MKANVKFYYETVLKKSVYCFFLIRNPCVKDQELSDETLELAGFDNQDDWKTHFLTKSKPLCRDSLVADEELEPPTKDCLRLFVTKKKVQGIEAKLQTYLSAEQEDGICDPLTFWHKEVHWLPILAKLAWILLAIPATSTPSKRSSSAAGRTITNRLSSINTPTLEAAVCLKTFNKFLWSSISSHHHTNST